MSKRGELRRPEENKQKKEEWRDSLRWSTLRLKHKGCVGAYGSVKHTFPPPHLISRQLFNIKIDLYRALNCFRGIRSCGGSGGAPESSAWANEPRGYHVNRDEETSTSVRDAYAHTAALTCDELQGFHRKLNKNDFWKVTARLAWGGGLGWKHKREKTKNYIMLCISPTNFHMKTTPRLCCRFSLAPREHAGSRPAERKDASGHWQIRAVGVGCRSTRERFPFKSFKQTICWKQGWK